MPGFANNVDPPDIGLLPIDPPSLPEPPKRQIGFHVEPEEKPKAKRKTKA